MLPRYQPLFLFLLHLFILLAIPATIATPTPNDKRTQSVVRRAFSGPTTVTDVSTINSPSGPVTQTCLITLTPITLPDGSQAVEMVKNCKLANDAGGSAASTNNVTTTVSTLPSTVAAALTTNAAVSVNGASTVTAAATPSGNPSPEVVAIPTTTSQAEASATTGLAANGAVTPGSVTAAAAQQTASGSFTLPGKKLSVLPIGLGVFAGISVIALIVVGLVTYERTKYRKAFRQRKLAEAGAQMGYGGMA